MSTTDATFLWETEALRETRSRHPVAPPTSPRPSAEERDGSDAGERPSEWVTLRDAHEATGIPVETLRKWARRGSIPSQLDESVKGTRRMIRLEDVESRAGELGRDIGPIATAVLAIEDPFEVAPADENSTVSPSAIVDPSAPPPQDQDAPAVTVTLDRAPAEEGTMIVPIAAWDKMLMQLGNLHEAGQQLAEARERAAKAETENRFLKERMAEMRSAGEAAGPTASVEPAAVDELPPDPVTPATGEQPGRAAGTTRRLMRSLQRWRIEVRRH